MGNRPRLGVSRDALRRWDKMRKQYEERIQRQHEGLTRMTVLNTKVVAALFAIAQGEVENPTEFAYSALEEAGVIQDEREGNEAG